MKHYLRCVVSIGIVLEALCVASGYEPIEDYTTLSLSKVVVQAEQIGVCVPVFRKYPEDYKFEVSRETDLLWELKDAKWIFEEKKPSQSDEAPRHLILIEPKTTYMDSPILMPGKKNLVFLKKKAVDEAFRTRYRLQESDEVLELCPNVHAAIDLDFSAPSLAKKILADRYNITEPNVVLDAVKDLTEWRTLKGKKKDKVENLLKLLTANKGQLLYEDNVPPILQHLGVTVVKKDGEFRVAKASASRPKPPMIRLPNSPAPQPKTLPAKEASPDTRAGQP